MDSLIHLLFLFRLRMHERQRTYYAFMGHHMMQVSASRSRGSAWRLSFDTRAILVHSQKGSENGVRTNAAPKVDSFLCVSILYQPADITFDGDDGDYLQVGRANDTACFLNDCTTRVRSADQQFRRSRVPP